LVPAPVLRRLTITRLGEGLRGTGLIRPQAAARTAAAVEEFAALATTSGAEPPIVVATHALRTARNPDELLARLTLPVRTLSGDEEARLGYQGVLAGMGKPRRSVRLLVVDIGGGSVELTVGSHTRIEASCSLPIGAVVLTERFLSHDPPSAGETAALLETVARTLDPSFAGIARPPQRVFGVGGTITTMAAIEQRLTPYDPGRVHGFQLTRRAVNRITSMVLGLPLVVRRDLVGLQPERADIITAGALVLQHLLIRLRAPGITVSEADLLWALVLPPNSEDDPPPTPGPRTRA
jgi:exopolyphosphatase/guanosine-5'-triphosphate,3'-diphosphate pyrophosphatase